MATNELDKTLLQTAPEFHEKCRALDLNPERILKHWRRIYLAVKEGRTHFIKIATTCRTNNFGIIPFIGATKAPQNIQGIVAFVPAAGASSRYFQPLHDLQISLTAENLFAIKAAASKLHAQGAEKWILPEEIRVIIRTKGESNFEQIRAASLTFRKSKALLPCTTDGTTFLEMKIDENLAMDCIENQVFVVNPQTRAEISEQIAKLGTKASRIKLLEQGFDQSTIRFSDALTPYQEKDHSYSPVPAGHGTLAHLLPEVAKQFPGTKSVLIRNIDNITGVAPSIISATHHFISFHNMILTAIEQIRAAIDGRDWKKANATADSIIRYADEFLAPAAESGALPEQNRPLWELQARLFHCTPPMLQAFFTDKLDDSLLATLYTRPVNTLGQVQNTQHDVGGTPVFATERGVNYKICLEAAHSSPEDKRNFLENHELATHFNPVFALAEVRFPAGHYEDGKHGSWILSKRSYQGHSVYYHESVLYELLGNNILANAVFVEIPRLLFNPHKSVLDCKPQTHADWVRQ